MPLAILSLELLQVCWAVTISVAVQILAWPISGSITTDCYFIPSYLELGTFLPSKEV